MSNFSTSALPVVSLDALCAIADASDLLLGAGLKASEYPKGNVYSTVEGATFAALICAAHDLHVAALAVAMGKGFASAEFQSNLQNAEGAVTLVARYAEQEARKRDS
ncbi:hypothetical protein [Shinella zoogloeoides]|uniref:hypothetical protein n=1 Tax=Shinella zoogloeoides TaxID=352475 RepID=UPI0028AB59C0|nr:hypothetical protein [Shinella zoogloeoides]